MGVGGGGGGGKERQTQWLLSVKSLSPGHIDILPDSLKMKHPRVVLQLAVPFVACCTDSVRTRGPDTLHQLTALFY